MRGFWAVSYTHLSVGVEGQFHHRLADGAPHIAPGVGDGDDIPRRPPAAEGQGDALFLPLQAAAHDGGSGEQPAQGGGDHGRALVDLLGPGDNVGGVDGGHHHSPIFTDGAQYTSHLFSLLLGQVYHPLALLCHRAVTIPVKALQQRKSSLFQGRLQKFRGIPGL